MGLSSVEGLAASPEAPRPQTHIPGIPPSLPKEKGLVADGPQLPDVVNAHGNADDNEKDNAKQSEHGEPKTTIQIVMPDGQAVGVVHKRAGRHIRTVSPAEFDTIEHELRQGAKPASRPGYSGHWYERPDGSSFGIRNSGESGQPSTSNTKVSILVLGCIKNEFRTNQQF